jgi:hypothetical protein
MARGCWTCGRTGGPRCWTRLRDGVHTGGIFLQARRSTEARLSPLFSGRALAVFTEGVPERGGSFLPLTRPDLAALGELFRRPVLAELVKARRLSEGFCDRLLTWRHSGFSVYGTQVVLAEENAGEPPSCMY